jgi:xanthine dehydrogenase accessory factor
MRIEQHTAVLALTHDPKIDDLALTAALRSPCFYIGALGSRKTYERRVQRLAALGFTKENLTRIRAPAGLDTGAVPPAEIAVFILSKIIASLRKERRRSA